MVSAEPETLAVSSSIALKSSPSWTLNNPTTFSKSMNLGLHSSFVLPHSSSFFLNDLIQRICSMNKPDLLPDNPFLFPAIEKF